MKSCPGFIHPDLFFPHLGQKSSAGHGIGKPTRSALIPQISRGGPCVQLFAEGFLYHSKERGGPLLLFSLNPLGVWVPGRPI